MNNSSGETATYTGLAAVAFLVSAGTVATNILNMIVISRLQVEKHK